MTRNAKPGSLNTLRGFNETFNRTWTAVQSHRDRHGNVVSWSFMCGCGEEKFYKTRRHGDKAHGLALANVTGHRCRPNAKARQGIGRVVKAA